MRVVLTGASGFIGRETIAPLRALGAEVHALGRHAVAEDGVTIHAIDLLTTDPAALLAEIAPTHLLHLAWYAEPGKFWQAPENLDWVAASLRLVRGFAAAGGQRAAIAGSCAEYDWGEPVLDEAATPLRPATLYGEAKASLYRILLRAAPTLDLSLGWGRVFFPYGPRESGARLVGGTLDALAAGREATFSTGTQERDFLHVEDVAAALVALLASKVSGAVNIGSGEAIAVRALAERLAAFTDGAALLRFGVRPVAPDEPPRLVAATARLEQELGFRPRFTLDAGLRDAWVRRAAPAVP